ncbi:MAG TPA: DUF1501 domain-containing protein [Candidatus Saccharimonadia bacterium]|nr:DUF1501 domain-containing protein [Candidatus Saccharimonadia bacterium]
MTDYRKHSRRDFLRNAGCLVAAGGVSSFVPKLNLLGTALAQSATSGYKAIVCLYLGGGSDSWNLLVPTGANADGQYSHARYVTARNGLYSAANPTGLAIPNVPVTGALPPAIPLGGAGNLGLNPFAPELASLYNTGRLALLPNIGTLREPITRATFNTRRRPPQLYSHNDQTTLWHIGSSTTTQTTTGFGGMIAGYTANTNTLGLPPAISIAGQTRYLVGERFGSGDPVFPFQMSTSATTPATALTNYSATSTAPGEAARRGALVELLNAAYPSPLSTEYADIVDRSLVLSRDINAEIASLSASSNPVAYPVNTSVADQLRSVARMIRISRPGFVPPAAPAPEPPYASINANRQVFYVSTGGYDTHNGQITSLGATGHHLLLQRLSQAVNWFYNEMAAIGMADEVVLFTMSDFGRTINSNGNGTDHAWGGVQFVVGGPGAVSGGGNTFGRYPRIELDVSGNDPNGESFSRGQMLPTLAVDQLGATLARWMGVDDGARLLEIFPNLDNFTGLLASPAQTPSFAYQSRVIPGLLNGVA